MTQAAIEPASDISIVSLNHAGTFWYHAHNRAGEQVARGLYGPLIVRDWSETVGEHDVLIVADDWLINEKEQIDATSFGSLGHWSHGGRLGNALSINGQFSPSIPIPAKGLMKLRLINTANARILTFALSGALSDAQSGASSDVLPMRVICVDGSPCEPFSTNRITLGPAQRGRRGQRRLAAANAA